MIADACVAEWMKRKVVTVTASTTVEEDSGLMHALATMVKHQLQDLPIVDKAGRLVAIASRVDIARAFFAARVGGGLPP